MSGLWREIKATTRRKHPWVFAHYVETPSEHAGGQWYAAFHFRNADRTKFGFQEFVGDLLHHQKLRQMATRVVVDTVYRDSMLSDKPELPKWWKRH
jgi:hypothetical protein